MLLSAQFDTVRSGHHEDKHLATQLIPKVGIPAPKCPDLVARAKNGNILWHH